MRLKRLLAVMGLWAAIGAGGVGGLALGLLARPIPAFSFGQVLVVSWRGGGDAGPAGVETSGWSAPMFYTTPAQGAPQPPDGKYPTGVWAPGDTVERSFVVKNVDATYMMRLEQMQIQISGDQSLAPWYHLRVKGPAGETLLQGSLADFTDGVAYPFATPVLLSLGTRQALTFDVRLDRRAGNPEQGRTVKASFTLVASEYALPATVDVHPVSWPNPINPGAKGSIPVAVNGSATLSVRTFDPSTARFGPNRIPPLRYAYSDWNKDGYMDIVFHFDNPASGITCGMTSASLTVASHSGEVYEGADAIVTPPCR